MGEDKKSRGFTDIVKDGLGYFVQRILASQQITDGVEKVMQQFEDRIMRIEERLLRKMFSFVLIGFGAVFLMFALFFSLREFLGWSNSAAFFSIGIIVFSIGLILKVKR